MKKILFMFAVLFTLTACDSSYNICKQVCANHKEGYVPIDGPIYLDDSGNNCRCVRRVFVPVLQQSTKKVEK